MTSSARSLVESRLASASIDELKAMERAIKNLRDLRRRNERGEMWRAWLQIAVDSVLPRGQYGPTADYGDG